MIELWPRLPWIFGDGVNIAARLEAQRHALAQFAQAERFEVASS